MTAELASKNKIGYSLVGVRRVGKTSSLRELARRLVAREIPMTYVSLWRVTPQTVDQFVRMLDRATIGGFAKRLPVSFKFEELLATGAKALDRLLSGLKLSANVTENLEVSVSYIRREMDDVERAISNSFMLAEHLARMTKCDTSILMLDEFPSIIDLTYGERNQKIGDSIVRAMRTIFEDFDKTKLVVSGSYRDTMNNLVLKQRAPFYRQLLLREVHPFNDKEFEDFIRYYMPALNFADEARTKLYSMSSGIPYNLQLVGKELGESPTKKIGAEEVQRAVEDVLKKEGELIFREYTERMKPSELKVLKVLASLPWTKPSKIAAEEFMDKDTVNSSLNLLVKKGVLTRRGRGIYEFSDNLFAEWLRVTDVLDRV